MGRNARNLARHRAAGFTLVEMLVGVAVTSMLLLGIIGAFVAGSTIARVETQRADMQQSLRAGNNYITRLVRMAGRGGLPLALAGSPVYQTPALSFRNEVGVGADSGEIAIAYPGSPMAVPGSDILTVRGVFNSPVYQLNTLDPATFNLVDAGGNSVGDPTLAAAGTLVVSDMTPTGTPQDLSPLADAKTAAVPEPLILVSPIDERIFAVVELNPSSTIVGANQITVAFKVQGMTHPLYRNLYNSGGGSDPVLPPGMTSAAYLGLLEEYRFYVRVDPDRPRLSMARMFPATETPYRAQLANAQIDLADNMLDLQVAVAFDTSLGPVATDKNEDGDVDEDDMEIYEADDGQNDDWLFNAAADDETTAPWTGAVPQPELFFIRLSLLGRSGRREVNYQSPALLAYEDVAASRILAWNSLGERMYQRRLQQIVIEMRNL